MVVLLDFAGALVPFCPGFIVVIITEPFFGTAAGPGFFGIAAFETDLPVGGGVNAELDAAAPAELEAAPALEPCCLF